MVSRHIKHPDTAFLFQPFHSRKLNTPTRIVLPAMTRGFSPNGVPTDQVAAYYKRRAGHEVGLIITEGTFIDEPSASPSSNYPNFFGGASLRGWKKVLEAVHATDCKIAPQLWHVGMARPFKGEDLPHPELPPIGPSGIDVNTLEQTAEPMSISKIEEVINAFAKAAADAKRLGFDGVELHGAHGYLIDQFFWKETNRRTDEYGGDLTGRTRFASRIIHAVRKAVGSPAFARANLPDNTPAHYRAFARRCAARNIRILPYDDPDYPLAFSRIPDMPLVLYCTGDPLWLNEPGAVGMVGSRRPTEYGLQAAADLGSGLAKNGAIIVSGLADGLDSAGHRAAVKENCPTIGVLGVPIDRTYPASNRELRKKIEQKGCVISEYPPESGPVGPNGFLQRNRLIAALSSALVVVEAQEKSGTMSTVNHAERYGKPVFVVPGSIYSPNSAGTNALLREGRAKAVCKPGDLFGVLGLRGAAAPAAVRSAPDPMSETERRVLACIGPKAKGVEELGAASGLPTGLLLGTLMKLELAGRVTCLPGKRYILR